MNISASIASSLFGQPAETAPTMPGMLVRSMLEKTQDKQVEAYRQEPMVERSIEYFRENAKNIESVDALIDDFQLKTFLLEAFGLEQFAPQNGFVKKLLTEDFNDPGSLARQMLDPRISAMAEELRLDKGMGYFKSDANIESLIELHVAAGFEKKIGEQNMANRQVMYFERKLPDVENIFNLMADKTLKEVARVAGGLPEQVAQLDFDKQVELFESKINMEKLKSDPEYLDELMRTYLIRKDAETAGQFGVGMQMAGLFSIVQPIGSDQGSAGFQPASFGVNIVV
jgi:hypothetical protein